jgi:hypothetical protein
MNATWRERLQTLEQEIRDHADVRHDLGIRTWADQIATLLAEAEVEDDRRLIVDRDAEMRYELRRYLDTLMIDGDTIGDIRCRLFLPWDSAWNGWVREETAARERSAAHPAALEE